MKVKKVIEQIEHIFGRQTEGYMIQLINDALIDIGSKKQHYEVTAKQDLVPKQRWYTLSDDIIDIIRVEIKDTNNIVFQNPTLTTLAGLSSNIITSSVFKSSPAKTLIASIVDSIVFLPIRKRNAAISIHPYWPIKPSMTSFSIFLHFIR